MFFIQILRQTHEKDQLWLKCQQYSPYKSNEGALILIQGAEISNIFLQKYPYQLASDSAKLDS